MTLQVVLLTEELAELIALPFRLLKLEPHVKDDCMVRCLLNYEDGSKIHIVVMHTARKRLFLGTKECISIAFAKLASNDAVQLVLHRTELPMPNGNHDLRFCIKLSATIRTVAWSLYRTTNMGLCTELHL